MKKEITKTTCLLAIFCVLISCEKTKEQSLNNPSVGLTKQNFDKLLVRKQPEVFLEERVSYGEDGRVRKIVSKQLTETTYEFQYDDSLQTIYETITLPDNSKQKNEEHFRHGLLQESGEDSIVYHYHESAISYYRNLQTPGYEFITKFYFNNLNVVRIEYYPYPYRILGALARVMEYTYDKALSPYSVTSNDTTRWRNLTWRGNLALGYIAITMSPEFLSVNNIISKREVYVASGNSVEANVDFRYDYNKNGRPVKKYWTHPNEKKFNLQDEFVY
jgi:hypothetical protein